MSCVLVLFECILTMATKGATSLLLILSLFYFVERIACSTVLEDCQTCVKSNGIFIRKVYNPLTGSKFECVPSGRKIVSVASWIVRYSCFSEECYNDFEISHPVTIFKPSDINCTLPNKSNRNQTIGSFHNHELVLCIFFLIICILSTIASSLIPWFDPYTTMMTNLVIKRLGQLNPRIELEEFEI